MQDLYLIILEKLRNFEKKRFLFTHSSIFKLKDQVLFTDIVRYDIVSKFKYFNNYTNIKIDCGADDRKYIFPKNIKKLYIDYNVDANFIIPNTIKYLTFGFLPRNKISCIPNSVTHLTFGFYFNHPIKGYIPNSVTHLVFDTYFNQDIKDCIPNSVTHLTFDTYFNQDIKDCIPNSVKYLVFGSNFNQNIKNCIPNSVKYLIFGDNFNQDIKDCIPCSVLTLGFGAGFNKRLNNGTTENYIPESVIHILFNKSILDNFDIYLSNSKKIMTRYKQHSKLYLPKYIKYITIDSIITIL